MICYALHNSLATSAFGQELVPVTSRKNVGWGANSGELPAPINPQEEEGSLAEVPDRQRGELPRFTGGPPRRSEIITQRYPNGKPQVTRRVMQDEEGNFLNNGPWKLFSPRGEIMAEGSFRQGLMDGSWRRWHPTNSPGLFMEAPFDLYQGPFLSVATFTQGKLDGVWTIFDRQRRKIIELPYRDGKRNGRAVWYFPNNKPMREVDFQQGQVHGQMNEYNRQGRPTRETNFVEGQELITRTEYYFKDQKRAESNYLGPKASYISQDDWWNAAPAQYETVGQELQHGTTREWYPSGQLRLAGQYRQGVQVGLFRWWHDNGQKQIEGQFQEGEKTGTWSWYHANGRKAIQGNFLSNVETGIWRWWDENGELEDERDFGMESLNLEDIDPQESDGDEEDLEIMSTPPANEQDT